MLDEVAPEFFNILYEKVDSRDKAAFELCLLSLKVISNGDRLLNKLAPVLSKDGLSIWFVLLVEDFWEVSFEESVHFDNRPELDLDLRFLPSDLLQGAHDVAETVNVLGRLLDFEFDLLDIVSQELKHAFSSLMQIFSVGVFPLFDPLLETSLDVLSFEAEGSDLMEVHDELYLLLVACVLFESFLEVLQLRIGGVEFLEAFVNSPLPEPVELLEIRKEFEDFLPGALD